MNSKRLLTIASFISRNDIVLDVGCDHGYLDIYLVKNKLCKKVYASDISINALNAAKDNFSKSSLKIDTFLSDGFKDIPVNFNTAVISGVGSSTILKILEDAKTPDKLILSSHNDLYKLRKNLNSRLFKIEEEKVVYENGHYYVIMLCNKGMQKLNRIKLKYGISNDIEYLTYLLNKNSELIKKVSLKKKLILFYDSLKLRIIIGKKKEN